MQPQSNSVQRETTGRTVGKQWERNSVQWEYSRDSMGTQVWAAGNHRESCGRAGLGNGRAPVAQWESRSGHGKTRTKTMLCSGFVLRWQHTLTLRRNVGSHDHGRSSYTYVNVIVKRINDNVRDVTSIGDGEEGRPHVLGNLFDVTGAVLGAGLC